MMNVPIVLILSKGASLRQPLFNELRLRDVDIEATMEYLKTSKNRLVLNFTSCYLTTGFPPTYAVPPAKQINPWLMNKLNETKESKDTLGVIVADFITKELAESIYMRNY